MRWAQNLAFAGIVASLSTPAFALDAPLHSSYSANDVRIESIRARLEILVGGSNVVVDISGRPEELAAISVSPAAGVLTIQGTRHGWRWNDDDRDETHVRLTIPRGTSLTLENDAGEATIGDTFGRLTLNVSSLDARIGSVSVADIHINGSGDISIGDVAGALAVQIRGSGDFAARSAQSADVSIAGSGDIAVGDVRGGLGARIAGSGDIVVRSVNGPVNASLMGSGDVKIGGGRAMPLKVSVLGSGDFSFDGEATDPDISIHGSGSVSVGSYSGTLTSRGNSNLDIGKRVGN